MEYSADELQLFHLWFQKSYARLKKSPPKIERELDEKLVVDIRELNKEDDVIDESDVDMGDIDLGS